MSGISVLGSLDPEFDALLTETGLLRTPDSNVVVLAYESSRDELIEQLIAENRLPVVLTRDPELARRALERGAIDAVLGLPSAPALRERLEVLLRMDRASTRRLKSQERRARRALAELHSTQDLLGRLIDATPNPVMAADHRGRVLVFNRAAEQALGYDGTWVREHMHVSDIYGEAADARRVLTELRGSSNGIVQGLDVVLRARSGELMPVVLSSAEVYGADGAPMATVGVFQDRRAELALEGRLEETTEQLIESEKRAAAIEVAGAAAHELNQPLTTVMGTIELLLLRDTLDPDVRQRLLRCTHQLERMAEIVRALARTSRGRTVSYLGSTRILDLHGSHE